MMAPTRRWRNATALAVLMLAGTGMLAMRAAGRADPGHGPCAEVRQAEKSTAAVKGPGYAEGLEHLDRIELAIKRDDGASFGELLTVSQELRPMLGLLATVYEDGGFAAVKKLPTKQLDDFETTMDRFDVEAENACAAGDATRADGHHHGQDHDAEHRTGTTTTIGR